MASFNTQGAINWPGLDRRLIRDWTAKAGRATDRVERFVFAWVVFNHYYSAWAVQANIDRGDRAEVRAFAMSPWFRNAWQTLTRLRSLSAAMQLPIPNRGGQDVPIGIAAGSYTAARLTPEQYLDVLYQVRCDLFHARRGVRGFDDEVRLAFAAEPTHDLVRLLVRDTTPR